MSKIIELQEYRKRKKLQSFLRVFTIISMTIVIGIFIYALAVIKRDHPVRLPPYIEFKAG
jgi:ABC-type phosphate transport system permease subunit